MVRLKYFLAVVLCAVVAAAPVRAPVRADEAQDRLVEQGVAAYDAGNYQRAKDILVPLAEAGHPKAMNIVGLMYSKGFGYPSNRTTACDWYERSANEGYSSGSFNLSHCYYHGSGRPQDEREWLFWTKKAALQGHKGAQGNLAGLYVETDRDEYLYWAQKAAAQGNARAKVLMWLKGDGDLVANVKLAEIVCVIVRIAWLNDRYDACD